MVARKPLRCTVVGIIAVCAVRFFAIVAPRFQLMEKYSIWSAWCELVDCAMSNSWSEVTLITNCCDSKNCWLNRRRRCRRLQPWLLLQMVLQMARKRFLAQQFPLLAGLREVIVEFRKPLKVLISEVLSCNQGMCYCLPPRSTFCSPSWVVSYLAHFLPFTTELPHICLRLLIACLHLPPQSSARRCPRGRNWS
jgi:hypothetical protein